ncbi:MAG: FAD-dependent oxidoreductase [Gammaproteobacteria bacterium]|nr:FAD-dependent oxidoreductase [Gammaproteobacteria bacterium]
MKDKYQVVIVGGGVVGASVLYHLAKFGWTDCAIIERSILTAGSSWHAAGGVHALNADPNMAALQGYTLDLLSEIQEESGQDIGLHMTGGITIASTPERWEWLQGSLRTYQTIGIEDVHLMTPQEVKDKCPIMNVDGVYGGLWADREGYVDTTGTVWAYAKAAKQRGAEVIENTKVESLSQRADGSWDVVTEKGVVHAEHVVNAGGLWAKQVGRMAGLDLPVSPLKHHYLVTETIPAVAELDFEVPMTVDLEGFTYMRQWDQGILVGIYEVENQHWAMDGAPWNYGMELFEQDFDRIENELALTFDRYPDLNNVGIKNWVNGAFTFSPDGNPLVGPVRGLPNYWLACGVMAGFLQGGGVGKTLAEWMIYGETEADAWSMDIARYGKYTSNREYIKQTTGQFYSRRFVMSYPNEQLPAGRDLKRSGVWQAQKDAGAIFGNSWGLEVPLVFGQPGYSENTTLHRSNAFELVRAEHLATRNQVGMLDITGFSRYRVTGAGATAWLDQLFATKLPTEHRARLAVMLGHDGRLKGDLTCFNWGDGSYWIMGSYYLREWHLRWFHDHLPGGTRALSVEGEVQIEDISDNIGGYAISGPNARKVLEKLTHEDVSQENFKFMACREMDVGLIRARVGRLSVAGELGYEINCHALELAPLRERLIEAGADLGLREYGYYALNSLRMEKSFGIWNKEFMQAYTPGETGMDRWIAWDKDAEFVGKQAAAEEKAAGRSALKQVLVTLEVDDATSEAGGYEPVWGPDGSRVGMTTSGGYGYCVDKSLAMALIDPAYSAPGTELTTHLVGALFKCRVIEASPWDPTGQRIRT